MTPREERLAAAEHLKRELDRVQRRLAVQRQHLADLHTSWTALAGDTANQHAVDVRTLLADADHHLDLALGRAELAHDQMNLFIGAL